MAGAFAAPLSKHPARFRVSDLVQHSVNESGLRFVHRSGRPDVPDDRYLMTRVSEALLRAGGDRALAQKVLLDEAARDQRLLNAMVAPYLPNIANRVVQRVCDRVKPPEARRERAAEPVRRLRRTGLSPTDMDTIVGQLGSRIGEAAAPGGLEALLRPAVRPKASAQHADSIRQLAVAFARKRIDQPG